MRALRAIRATVAVVVLLGGVVAGSYLVHRRPTPTASTTGGSLAKLGLATTTSVPGPVAGLTWMPLGVPRAPGARAPMAVAFPAGPAATPTEAAVWIDRSLVRADLIPGATVPSGPGWSPVAQVPAGERSALLAAFNGGFSLADAHGGFYAQGRTGSPLVAGAASLVIRTDGSADVGQWGRDVKLDSTVAAVRQNLVLLVDGGSPTPAVAGPFAAWGPTATNVAAEWRTAVGVDRAGNLIFVVGSSIDPASLAALAVRAGCVRAMEMGINLRYVTFNTYAVTDGAVHGSKLLAAMSPSGDRYLTADNRDFVALYRR